MKTVRAAENRVTVVDVDEPPGAGELLEMTAPSVCASDLMYIRLGSRQILGHERRPASDGTASVDDVVRGAEQLAQLGVSTLVTGAMGNDPAGWLESTFGPAMDRIKDIETKRL